MTDSDFERISEQRKRISDRIQAGMREDIRFRRMVDACTAEARATVGPLDPERPERDAFETASYAAAMMLAWVYDIDGELASMRAERDRYRKLAEDSLMLRPMPMVINTAVKQ